MSKFIKELSDKTIIIIAHRGASAYAPENTLSAFEKAFKMKADMIELDLQLTLDNQWVVMHDLSLKRTCGLRKKVQSLTLPQIKTLDCGSWYSPDFSGEKVLTLEEALIWSKNKIVLNLEIKGDFEANLWQLPSLLKKISDHGMKKGVIISSFDWKILKELRRYDKNIALGLLVNRQTSDRFLKQAFDLKAFCINLPKYRMKKKLSRQIHAFQMLVFIYTVNSLREMEKSIQMGVNGFFTNYPDIWRK